MPTGTEATMPSFSLTNTSGLIGNILGLMTQITILGGAMWTVWGAVALGLAMKDNNGPNLQHAVWQIVGGALILIAGFMFNNLVKF